MIEKRGKKKKKDAAHINDIAIQTSTTNQPKTYLPLAS